MKNIAAMYQRVGNPLDLMRRPAIFNLEQDFLSLAGELHPVPAWLRQKVRGTMAVVYKEEFSCAASALRYSYTNKQKLLASWVCVWNIEAIHINQ